MDKEDVYSLLDSIKESLYLCTKKPSSEIYMAIDRIIDEIENEMENLD